MDARGLTSAQAPVLSLELLRRQFMQAVDHEHLTLPSARVLVDPKTQSFIYNRMFNLGPTTQPAERYRLRVLKSIIERVEEGIQDPDQDVCNPEIPLPYNLYETALCLHQWIYIFWIQCASFVTVTLLFGTSGISSPDS